MSEKINPHLLEVIACPRFLARLQYDQENQRLICCYEHIAYPIKMVCQCCLPIKLKY